MPGALEIAVGRCSGRTEAGRKRTEADERSRWDVTRWDVEALCVFCKCGKRHRTRKEVQRSGLGPTRVAKWETNPNKRHLRRSRECQFWRHATGDIDA